jgi:hypothetical protein
VSRCCTGVPVCESETSGHALARRSDLQHHNKHRHLLNQTTPFVHQIQDQTLTRVNMPSSLDPQLQCALLSAPTEIRYAIYAYIIPKRVHLILDDCSLRLSPCVQHVGDDDPECTPRQYHDISLNDDQRTEHPLRARRLCSPWGDHWRCEEELLENDSEMNTNMLFLVCKLMSVDAEPRRLRR